MKLRDLLEVDFDKEDMQKTLISTEYRPKKIGISNIKIESIRSKVIGHTSLSVYGLQMIGFFMLIF